MAAVVQRFPQMMRDIVNVATVIAMTMMQANATGMSVHDINTAMQTAPGSNAFSSNYGVTGTFRAETATEAGKAKVTVTITAANGKTFDRGGVKGTVELTVMEGRWVNVAARSSTTFIATELNGNTLTSADELKIRTAMPSVVAQKVNWRLT